MYGKKTTKKKETWKHGATLHKHYLCLERDT